MILPKPQVQAILAGAREARFPADYEHPAEETTGEVAPVRTAPGRDPVCWVVINGWSFDDDTDEYVLQLRRVPAPDVPRLLMPAGRPRHSELGYTDKSYLALRDEPEAVDEETLAWFALDAKERGKHRSLAQAKQNQQARKLLTIEQRMQRARAAARRNRIDVRDEIKALKRMQTRQQASAIVQLERVERIAYRDAA